MKRIILTSTILLSVLLFSFCSKKIPKGVEGVRNFDVNQYLGKWYEIARLDHSFERNLNNVTATYSFREDGLVKVENRGYNTKKEKWEDAEGRAKFKGDRDIGELRVSFFGPFFGAYNIVALDDDYKYALVLGDNYGFMWILSREKTIPAEVRAEYLKIAEETGYDTSELIWVEHDM